MNVKRFLRWVLAIQAMVFVNSAFAEEYLALANITFIRSFATWTLVGVASPPATTCDSWGEQFRFDHTTIDGKVLLTQMLTAQTANRAVDLWFFPSSAPGTTMCATAAMGLVTMVRTR